MNTDFAVNLTNTSFSNSRRSLDWYPTPPEATIALLNFLDLPTTESIWECACGNGAMSRIIENFGYNVISTDLPDYEFGKSETDFTQSEELLADWIITNPPFNRSEEFIRTAAKSKPKGSAFLLKSQFWHSKKRYPLFKSFQPSYILPLTWRPDFLNGERGGSPTMDCIWTVWIQGISSTTYHPLLRPVVNKLN